MGGYWAPGNPGSGAGIFNRNDLILLDGSIRNNRIPDMLHANYGRYLGNGGGLMNTPGATVEIKQVEISGNYASGSGGGIQNEGMLDFYEGVISQNQAHLCGGGIFNSAEIRLGAI